MIYCKFFIFTYIALSQLHVPPFHSLLEGLFAVVYWLLCAVMFYVLLAPRSQVVERTRDVYCRGTDRELTGLGNVQSQLGGLCHFSINITANNNQYTTFAICLKFTWFLLHVERQCMTLC